MSASCKGPSSPECVMLLGFCRAGLLEQISEAESEESVEPSVGWWGTVTWGIIAAYSREHDMVLDHNNAIQHS